jgi:aminoglycoside phosphotransferase (APT) family kinase protein
MERVRGEHAEPAAGRRAHRRRLAAAVAVLERIRDLPIAETGLEGEPAHPPQRQVDRWEPLMTRGPAELTQRGPLLAERLRRRAPAAARTGLVHGDFTPGNLLFSGDEVCAVLDWEIAELGPPEVDLACLCVAALRRRYTGPNPGGELAVSLDEILAAAEGYREMPWFVAAGCYKYAAILSYNLDLHLRGRRVDPVYEGLRETIKGLIETGLPFLD